MSDKQRPPPNTYLGEVTFCVVPFFGTLEWILQEQLGMSAKPPSDLRNNYLDVKTQTAGQIWDFFSEVELPDGRLALRLCADDMGMTDLAFIETNFFYEKGIEDDDFLRFVSDLITYLRTRPIVDSNKCEGAELYTEEVMQMWPEESDKEKAFWDNLPSVTFEDYGLPHYLWLESLEFQTPEG
jgi:hypothetical protein